ncbi:hypothetical protein RIF29_41946 [Crotalaria pallida]|uniref:Uncharacterized protein n=1 Tax=Crotalaria pallida TaxID=3830 RepID=A0AAN9E6L1_CROPI
MDSNSSSSSSEITTSTWKYDVPQDVEIENIIEKVSRNLDQYKFSSLPNNLVATPSLVEELQKLAGRVKESTLVNLTENPEKEIKGILRREIRRGFKQSF